MLTRRLSQRPSQDDLQQRNIFKGRQSDAEIEAKAAEIKRSLSRKLSMRPTLQQLIDRKIYVIFNEYVDIYDVDQYDRRADKPWTKLTPTDKVCNFFLSSVDNYLKLLFLAINKTRAE